ncbi:MAG: DinB family protein [Mariprofundaceae bacterium]
MTQYLHRMARYNQWMNRRLCAVARELPDRELTRDRGAFFGSILATLNHIMVADLFWLRRFSSNKACRETLAPLADFPKPTGLRDLLFEDIDALAVPRERLDALILTFSEAWTDDLLAEHIRYRNMAGEKHARPLGALLQHFFNHQTHHRGQVSTLLFQAGVDPGVTDLLALVTEEG